MSRLSKTELINNKLCERIIHKGDCQSKVLSVIEKPGDFMNTSKVVKHLVKEKKLQGHMNNKLLYILEKYKEILVFFLDLCYNH